MLYLNEKAFKHAIDLIKQHKFIVDDNNSSQWTTHNPHNNAIQDYLKDHSIHEYGLWFLGINNSTDTNETLHYQLPCGDFTHIHKGALYQVLKEAQKHHYLDIKKAVEHLIDLIEKKELKPH